MLVAPVASRLSCRLPVEGTWTLSPLSPALPGSSRGRQFSSPPPARPRGSGGLRLTGVRLGSGSRAHPGPRRPGQRLLSAVCPAASPRPAALALLAPPCSGRTVFLHEELGSSPAPWLSCRGCRCVLWSVGCPPPSPAFCLLLGGTGVPAAPGGCPAVGPSPHGPGRLLWSPAGCRPGCPGPQRDRATHCGRGSERQWDPPPTCFWAFLSDAPRDHPRAIRKVVWGLTTSPTAGLWPVSA